MHKLIDSVAQIIDRDTLEKCGLPVLIWNMLSVSYLYRI